MLTSPLLLIHSSSTLGTIRVTRILFCQLPLHSFSSMTLPFPQMVLSHREASNPLKLLSYMFTASLGLLPVVKYLLFHLPGIPVLSPGISHIILFSKHVILWDLTGPSAKMKDSCSPSFSPSHSCLQSEWEVKKETSVHVFELADKITERGRLEALGGVEVKGGFFMFSLFELKLKTWQSS